MAAEKVAYWGSREITERGIAGKTRAAGAAFGYIKHS